MGIGTTVFIGWIVAVAIEDVGKVSFTSAFPLRWAGSIGDDGKAALRVLSCRMIGFSTSSVEACVVGMLSYVVLGRSSVPEAFATDNPTDGTIDILVARAKDSPNSEAGRSIGEEATFGAGISPGSGGMSMASKVVGTDHGGY